MRPTKNIQDANKILNKGKAIADHLKNEGEEAVEAQSCLLGLRLFIFVVIKNVFANMKLRCLFFLVSCTDDKGISMRILFNSEAVKSVQEPARPKNTIDCAWSVPGEGLCFSYACEYNNSRNMYMCKR